MAILPAITRLAGCLALPGPNLNSHQGVVQWISFFMVIPDMRILFISQQIDYEPQGIMYLSSVLKAAGHDVELAVAAYHDPLDVARSFNPDIAAYSVITGSQHQYFKINRRLKAHFPKIFSVFGGPHPTFFPEMLREDGVDALCRGESEEAFVELADVMTDGGLSEAKGLANWSFCNGQESLMNPVRPSIAALDRLPFPDWKLVYNRDPVLAKSKIKHFVTGRGCPYNCTYCFNHALGEIYHGKGKRFRQHSVDYVLENLRRVREHYPLEFVVFVDDAFVQSDRWLAEFAENYPRHIGLPFFCNTRANLVSKEQVYTLKAAGCYSVSMGIETGNDHLRSHLLNRHMSKEKILEAAHLIRAGGLQLSSTNIIGLPTSTLENDFETLSLNIRAKPSYAHVFIYQPYPRTELGEFSRRNGWMKGSPDDIGELATNHSVLAFSPGHKRGLAVLQRLFAYGVEWPLTVPLIKFMLRLPDNPIFMLLNKLWKGWAIKNRIHPVRMNFWETIQMIWHFLHIKS